jgi:hypothetical protein
MKTPPYIITDHSITLVIGNKPLTMVASNASYSEVKARIARGDFKGIEDLFDAGKALAQYVNGKIAIVGNTVRFNGNVVHNYVVDKIIAFRKQGLPYQPLLNFLEKLLQNPSQHSVEGLYSFLENGLMPITPEGNFQSYKGVQDNFYSVRNGSLTLLKGRADSSGHIYNGVGEEIECPRNEVSDNFNEGCARGLHIGSLNYAKGWGKRVVIVEVNPAHVVSVPKNEVEKMRCHAYKVVGEFNAPLDQNYTVGTTEQLSAKAKAQKRDSNGRFA